jgi:hypothetical protein
MAPQEIYEQVFAGPGIFRQRQDSKQVKCSQCGIYHKMRCPTKISECYKCGEIGHFAKCCSADPTEEDVDAVYKCQSPSVESFSDTEVYAIISAGSCKSDWWAVMQVGPPENQLVFKLDSGSDVTAISEEVLQRLQPQPKVKTAKGVLFGTCKQSLSVVGVFRARLAHSDNGNSIAENVYIVRKLQFNILSRKANKDMNLLKYQGSRRPSNKCEPPNPQPVQQRWVRNVPAGPKKLVQQQQASFNSSGGREGVGVKSLQFKPNGCQPAVLLQWQRQVFGKPSTTTQVIDTIVKWHRKGPPTSGPHMPKGTP